MSKAKHEDRSPLEGKPLRHPGQSLDEEIDRILSDEVITWMFMAIIGTFLAVMEWVRWFVSAKPHPLLVSLMAVALAGLFVWKFTKARARIAALKQGRDGEKIVGQNLDSLREKGYRVFHDLMGEGFNVDHVVISPHGIFTIETKTFSKPRGKKATVRVRNGELTVNGHRPDRNPMEQARAQSKWVNEILRESTGKDYPVRPVIVFPGWYVEPTRKEDGRGIWVLNPKALPSFIENEPVLLEQQDIMLATYHLSRHISTTN